MSSAPPPTVRDEEMLARYIFSKRHLRGSGAETTVKPDAYVPFKWVELSVTRHLGLSESEIWSHGDAVGDAREKTLLGRGDSMAKDFAREGLTVEAAPIPANANHANAIGWPKEKESQKAIALELVRFVNYVPAPLDSDSL